MNSTGDRAWHDLARFVYIYTSNFRSVYTLTWVSSGDRLIMEAEEILMVNCNDGYDACDSPRADNIARAHVD